MQTRATTTILFTDLVNSTELLQRAGDERAQQIFRAHHRLLKESVDAHGGDEVKWLGDGLMVAFTSAVEAVRCGIAMQQHSRRPAAGHRLQIRVGLHVGEALREEADYFGSTVVIARRLCDRADAGEILVSELLAQLLIGRDEFELRDRGALDLKGIREPVVAAEIMYGDDPAAALAHTPYVGRERQVATLRQLLADTSRGTGGVAMLVGEPGIGKTRAAEEFAVEARASGALVLWGRCYDGDWAPPFSPFVEAITQLAQTAPVDQLRGDLGPHAAVLTRIVPTLSMLQGDAGASEVAQLRPEDERLRLLDAVSSLLSALEARSPVVLVLDDLHWADRGTVGMLQHIASRAASRRMIVLGSYRDIEVDLAHPLSAAIADLRRQPNFHRLALEGLAPEAVGELLQTLAERNVPEELVTAISRETAGNPFFIREVLIHLVEERKIVHEDGAWTSSLAVEEMGIPAGVREVIARRLSRLSAVCLNTLRTASAMTGAFSWPVLREVSNEPEGDLLDALDEALAGQIVRERPGGESGHYDFSHALIRHALYEEISGPRRAHLHRQIGEALERLYGEHSERHYDELADHFCRAATGGDPEKGIKYGVLAAARAADMFAYDEALAHYERALEVCSLAADPDRRRECDLLLQVSAAAERVSAWQRAAETRWAAADLARQLGDAEALTRAALLGQRLAGAVDEREIGLLRDALQAVGEDDSPARARLLGDLAVALYWAERDDERKELARACVAMARRLDQPDVLVDALQSARSALRGPANVEERLAMSTEAIALAERAPTALNLRMRLREGYLARTEDLLELGEIEQADAEALRGLHLAEQFRMSHDQGMILRYRTMRALLDGRFDEVEPLITEAVRHRPAEAAGIPFFAAAQLLVLRSEQGRLPEIEPAIRMFVADSPTIPAWRAALAYLHVNLDRRAETAEEFEILAAKNFTDLPGDNSWLIALVLLTEACAYLGDPRRAPQLHALLLPYESRNVVIGDMDVCVGAAGRSLGLLATTMGDWELAERHFAQALEMNVRIGAHPWLARARVNYADMLLRRGAPGDAARAIAMLDTARSEASRMGMVALLSQTDALLATAGAVANR